MEVFHKIGKIIPDYISNIICNHDDAYTYIYIYISNFNWGFIVVIEIELFPGILDLLIRNYVHGGAILRVHARNIMMMK